MSEGGIRYGRSTHVARFLRSRMEGGMSDMKKDLMKELRRKVRVMDKQRSLLRAAILKKTKKADNLIRRAGKLLRPFSFWCIMYWSKYNKGGREHGDVQERCGGDGA